MITCGSCRNQHETANEVRECYATKGGNTKVGFKSTVGRKIAYQPRTARSAATQVRRQYPSTTRWAKTNMDTDWAQAKAEFADREAEQERDVYRWKMERDQRIAGQDLASDKQIKFLASLAYQMDQLSTADPTTSAESYEDALRKTRDQGMLTKSAASASIDELVTRLNIESTNQARKAEAAARKAPAVADGRYAVEEGGTLKFFKVNTPEDGRWKGFTFVDIMASDTPYPIKNRERRKAILATIAEDPKGAMLRYGIEMGHCGHCGRALTNETSREIGIGPVCREKMGW